MNKCAVKTITTAEPSIAPPPMPAHLVDKADWQKGKIVLLGAEIQPQDKALCGALWDRMGVSKNSPLCDGCADEFMRRHGFPHKLDRRPR
jgi:hypothetical protein